MAANSGSFKRGQSGNPSTKFKPGQSGNPDGRPAIVKSLQAACREHTPTAIKALLAALETPGERVPAANLLLAYGYGRPAQTQNVRFISSVKDLTDAELAAVTGRADEEEQQSVH